jgi:hypothetical protein
MGSLSRRFSSNHEIHEKKQEAFLFFFVYFVYFVVYGRSVSVDPLLNKMIYYISFGLHVCNLWN